MAERQRRKQTCGCEGRRGERPTHRDGCATDGWMVKCAGVSGRRVSLRVRVEQEMKAAGVAIFAHGDVKFLKEPGVRKETESVEDVLYGQYVLPFMIMKLFIMFFVMMLLYSIFQILHD